MELRPDLSFRVFGLYQETYFDLDQLQEMPHLQNLKLDVHLRGNPGMIEPGKLCSLGNLTDLSLNLFDLKDYSFIKGLNSDLDSLQIMADTMGGAINFDCKWLLEFPKLKLMTSIFYRTVGSKN
ncbi:hypothetical protein GPL15_17080 [Clostridium sp. MCC353]|uniref:hypothetical protein n=1 Tax=Clostridium sp. MCC353 TaxID=2592646 RepID=UPI001C01E487|nr:hypothetical protein [Clostridium sp. MCC353]MBT9778217.1 hypothetical protein [Clostridium sp. MCC353]